MNYSNEKSHNSMEMPCFLLGLGAGVIFTLLYAPMSGKLTRKLIGRRAQKGQDWVRNQAEVAGDFVTSHAEGLRERVKEVGEVIGGH